MDNFFDINIDVYFHRNKLDIVKILTSLSFSINKNIYIMTNWRTRLFSLRLRSDIFC